jgi:integrase/recombinase XerD
MMGENTMATAGRAHRFQGVTRTAPRDPLLDEWAAWQRVRRLTTRTVTFRCRTAERFAEEMGVSGVSARCEDVIGWLNSHGEWSRSTSGAYFSMLHAWFAWLVARGYRPDNPMAELQAPARPRGEPRPLSDAELQHLLGTRMHHRTRVMIYLAALAGLRVAEIARVKGSDVDVSRRVIWVCGKGSSKNTVPLHPLLVATASTMPRAGWWFPSENDPSKPVLAVSVSQVISRVMRRAGVSGTPHALRHWYGTSLLAAGADLRTVQACLRHASVATTQIYTQVPDDRRHEAIAALNPVPVTCAMSIAHSRRKR